MKTFAAASACALALLVAGTATAQNYRISFGDLDLGSAEGAAQFDRRVSRAARAACNGLTALDAVECTYKFRAQARNLLPESRRDEYARGRQDRASL